MDIEEKRKLKRRKKKAIQEGNYEQVYQCCINLGDGYLDNENVEEALREYHEAKDAATKLNNKIHFAHCNRMIGESLIQQHEYEKALKHHKVYLEYVRQEKDEILEQRALATLGRTYYCLANLEVSDDNLENLKSAKTYFLKSLQICERLSTAQLERKTLAEMRARLYLNLGLVCECEESENKFNEALEYVDKAIKICEKFDLWEDLCKSYSAKSSVYLQMKDPCQALAYLNETLNANKKVDKKHSSECEILTLKADAHIMMGDYKTAKKVLIKAYKLKSDALKDRGEIESKLKIVVSICRCLDELLKEDVELQSMRKLNEKLGDLCIKLKQFDQAISYYKQSLECAVKLGIDSKDLAPIYYSLYLTYKDNSQYQESLNYSLKEFELVKNQPSEASKTLLHIAQTMEILDKPFDEIMDTYNKSLVLAKKVNDLKLESLIYESLMNLQTKHGKVDLAEETKRELNTIECILPDSEETIETVEAIEDDINLDELDVYSDDEEETVGRPRRRTARSTCFKRNDRGEWPLHVAAINGNVDNIQKLIKQGHPVNVHDNAGWTPLHEACNHGNIEAARTLIELGADIDDRGEEIGCTPLHDAANNGHLIIMELLINKGASIITKTNNGETVLDCLLKYRERSIAEGDSFDCEYKRDYDKMVSKMESHLKKVGQSCTVTNNQSKIKQSGRQYKGQRARESTQSHDIDTKFNSPNKMGRKKSDEISFVCESRKSINDGIRSVHKGAAETYKDTIENLRRKPKNSNFEFNQLITKSKKSAFLDDDDVGDDWLENDLTDSNKRPGKRMRYEEIVDEHLKIPREMKTTSKVNNAESSRSSINETSFVDNNMDEELFPETAETTVPLRENCSFNGNSAAIPMDVESSHEFISPTIPFTLTSQHLSPNFKQTSAAINDISLQQYSSYSAHPPFMSTFPNPLITQCTNNTRGIKIRIEEKLFLIQIPEHQSLDTLNISWLADEASRRYAKINGAVPILQLFQDGAMLDCNDTISVLSNEKEVYGNIVETKLLSLVDTYNETCKAENIPSDSYIANKLRECEINNAVLEIRDRRLPGKIVISISKTIQYYKNLKNVYISSVFLKDSDLKCILKHILDLPIEYLDLGVNYITNDGLGHLVQCIMSGHLMSLKTIDLSHNPLGENCAENIRKLSQNLMNLNVLNLSSVGLTSKSFESSFDLNFHFGSIEAFDISFNNIGEKGISKLLISLRASKIRDLNISYTGGNEVIDECILFLEREELKKLQFLAVSGLHLTDENVEALAKCLENANELKKLDLSCNQSISTKSYQYLSKLKNLNELHLSGCSLVTNVDDMFLLQSISQLSVSSNKTIQGFNDAPYGFITKICNNVLTV